MKKLLLGLLLLPSLSAAENLQSKRFFQNTGGLIDHISPLLVPDNSATEIKNITLDDRGQLSKRNGYTVISSTSALLGVSTHVVTAGTFHKASSGSDFFAVVAGTAIYRIGNTYSSYSSITGSVVLTASTTNLGQTTHLQDKAIFCNDLNKPFYVSSTGNAVTISTNTFDTAKTCAAYGVYLTIGNTSESGTSYPSRIRWSDINNVNSFPSLNYIDVEPDDGDIIVGMVAFDESVYIFKRKSIYRMLITGLDGANAFIIRPVSRNIGAWAKNSIKVIPNVGIAFLAQNTAYILSDSGLTPIGDPIQRTFDTITRPMWTQAIAEVYPKKYQYWLAVSTSGTTNTEVLIYDYIQKSWTIYDNMNISMLSQAEDSNGNNILISGDYTATTYIQDSGSTDNNHNVSAAIQATYSTGNLLFDSPEITKGFKYLYVFTLGDSNYTLTVKTAYDYAASYETPQTIDSGSTTSLYDTGIYDTSMYPSSGISVTRLELNKSAKSLKLQFVNNNSGQIFGLIGWVVVYSLENFNQ